MITKIIKTLIERAGSWHNNVHPLYVTQYPINQTSFRTSLIFLRGLFNGYAQGRELHSIRACRRFANCPSLVCSWKKLTIVPDSHDAE
jgi:hypothetical protein